MKRIPRWALGGAILGLTAAALAVHLVAASGVTARSGRLSVHRGAVGPPAAEIRGNVFVTPGKRAQRLDEPASAPLVGTQGPLAALSPDGKVLAYNSFRWNRSIDWSKSFADEGIATGDALGVPTIRLHDLATGGETALEAGSQSLAWRTDGALAYTVGDPAAYRANLPFLADVVVRTTPEAVPQRWSAAPARYHALGWAGSTLLVARAEPGSTPDVVAFDGPGAARTLAPSSLLLGISPDGMRAVVAETPAETQHPHVRLLLVSDGSELASVPVSDAVDPVTGDALAWVSSPGSWQDDHLVVGSETGLVVLRVGESLAIEQVLHLDSATKPNATLFEPRFTDADAHTIVAWSGVPGTEPHMQAAQIRCDRFALSCTGSAAAAPAGVPRLVYDLSGGNR
jgi:hypothetical protein